MTRIAKGKNTADRAWFYDEDGRVPQTFYVMWDSDKCGSDVFLMQGKPFDPEKNKLPIIFNVENTKWGTHDYVRRWDFLPNSTATIPLVNSRALALLEEIAPGEFEALPTELHFEVDGSVITDYKVINVLNRVDCIDREHSVLQPEETRKPWRMYQRCYFHLDCLGSKLHMARDIEECVPLLFSNTLRQAIKESKLTGTNIRDSYAGITFWLDEK